MGTCENIRKKKVGRRRNALFPLQRISVDSAVVPLKFSEEARPVKLEEKIYFNLQSKKARSVLSSQSGGKYRVDIEAVRRKIGPSL